MLTYSVAVNDEDLYQILALQEQNLLQTLSEEEAGKEGFVTIKHDFDLLKAMNAPYPHIIAKDEDKVVGFSLVMCREFDKAIPLLVPIFDEINTCRYKGRDMAETDYFMMGQICVDKAYRGKGVFDGLYQQLKNAMSRYFPCVVTIISWRNIRSLKAHQRIGFKEIRNKHNSLPENDWIMVLWDWKE